MSRRADLLARMEAERARQFNLPGSEYDVRNTPNDWVAIATHYLNEEVRRGPARYATALPGLFYSCLRSNVNATYAEQTDWTVLHYKLALWT